MNDLEGSVRALLADGKRITADWDCGGDETLISFYVDGTRRPYEDPVFRRLYDIVADRLELPNAGEYFVKGGGEIRLEGGAVVIAHESEGYGYGWDPETDEEFEIENETLAGTEPLF